MPLSQTFQFMNRVRRLNRLLQVVLIVSLLLGVNYLAMQHFKRWDLTNDQRHALAAETVAWLKELRQPVQLVVTIPSNSARADEQALYRYVSRLLQNYAMHALGPDGPLLQIEYLDIFKELSRAEALYRSYGLESANAILVISGDRHRLLEAADLMRFEQQRAVEFSGEAALTSALMEVTQEAAPVLYFTLGHGESIPLDAADPRMARLANQLRSRNFAIRPLDLSRTNRIPEDAAAVVIADPQGSLSTAAVESLRAYLLERNGRLLAWVRPGIDSGLQPLLRDWGLTLPDFAVHEPDSAYRDVGGTLLLRNIGTHPITRSILEMQTTVQAGWSRPVLPRTAGPLDERLVVTPLLASSASSWAESNYLVQSFSFNPDSDLKGPVPVAFAAERRASAQLGIQLQGGRLVVIGSADVFSSQMLASLGNHSLLIGSLNWLVQRDRFLAIPPKPVESWQLAASEHDLRRIGTAFLMVPFGVALFGLLIYWLRHS
jgi:ABC-type uncharacterized transport system involved in gliding motility auxiliary subunit